MKILKNFFGARDYDGMNLTELVLSIVDVPSAEGNDALMRCLAESKVYGRAFVADEDSEGSLPISPERGPDGQSYLVVFCEFESIRRQYPNQKVAEVPGIMVLQAAHELAVGVAVLAPRRGSSTPAVSLPVSTLEAMYSRIPKYDGSFDIRIYNLDNL